MHAQVLFIKLLALSYFFAFFSLHSQVLGLFGKKGISPIKDQIDYFKQEKVSFFSAPTLFFYKSDDRVLKGVALLGIFFSVIAFLGFAPALSFAILWILYLSYYTVGSPFLNFQWDCLLLEAGLAGVFYTLSTPPPLLVEIWLRVLLFRLILASGLVKWQSGCPQWRCFKALDFHFETQPLPNLGGYLMHQILPYVSKLGCFLVFLLEGPVAFLFLGDAEMRLVGGLLTLFLQFLIATTGNYAFFNLLTVALTMTLFDDKYLTWLPNTTVQAFSLNLPLNIFLSAIAAVMILFNLILLLRHWLPVRTFYRPIRFLQTFGSLIPYGLFAVMTTRRDEIEIEGSLDGVEWKAYRFKYKPEALNQHPKQVAPLHPRLDWQMWFAALSSPVEEIWFQALIQRLLEPSPDVLKLLAYNPFPDEPPQMIRAKRYQYHFTSFSEWRKTGNYWKRKVLPDYLPPVSLSPRGLVVD